MKFKSKAIPEPSVGTDYSKVKDIVVPDQSMSLSEILERFTRREPLQIGHNVEFGNEDDSNPMNVDLEKLACSDLTEKAEFKEKLKDVQRKFEHQEKAKADKAKADKAIADKLAEEKRIRSLALKMAKGNSDKSA